MLFVNLFKYIYQAPKNNPTGIVGIVLTLEVNLGGINIILYCHPTQICKNYSDHIFMIPFVAFKNCNISPIKVLPFFGCC